MKESKESRDVHRHQLDLETAGRCGGDACIRDTRITVWGLESYRRLGLTDDQIMATIQGVTPADLEAAWDYVAAHKAEINQAIHDNDAGDHVQEKSYVAREQGDANVNRIGA
jgi:uncharacterized protein (DUF433 family)